MKKTLVIARHIEDTKLLVFAVPDGRYLSAGDYAIVDTAKGNDKIIICVSDNFSADPEVVVPLCGSKPENLKTIKAALIRDDYSTPLPAPHGVEYFINGSFLVQEQTMENVNAVSDKFTDKPATENAYATCGKHEPSPGNS